VPVPELEVFELDLDAKDEDDLFVLEDAEVSEVVEGLPLDDEDEPPPGKK
jgi:hypothetical protein